MRISHLATFLRWLIIGALFGMGAAVHAAPFAYISNAGSNTVSVINIATNAVVATVPVGAFPAGVAVNPAGAFAYVANRDSNNVSVIDTHTNTVVGSPVPVGASPIGVAVNAAGTIVFVANAGSNTVSVIDTATNAVTATIPVGTTPVGVALNPAGTVAYVTNFAGNVVSVIDTGTRTVVATVPVGTSPHGVAVNPAGTFAYVTNANSASVSVINTATNAVVATVPFAASATSAAHPVSVAINPAGTLAYVAAAGTDTISAIDTATNIIVMTAPVGSNVFGIALSPTGTLAYVASIASGSVSVFNTVTHVVSTNVPVGAGPLALGKFIGGNAGGAGDPASVTVISGSSQTARVGTPFAQPLVARVTDSFGNPVANATLTWAAPPDASSATFNGPSTMSTDANGLATISATANAIFGTYTVYAQVGGLSASFTLTNTITIATLPVSCSGNTETNADLVEDYYQAILRRPSEPGARMAWMGESDRLCALGADPKQVFLVIANAFFNAPEYIGFHRSDSEFVTDLYRTFFGRLPEAGGFSFWTGQLAQGMPRNNVMSSFLFLPEFTATMNSVFPGRTARAESYLVMNLYGGLFRRLADSGGYTYWTGQLQLAQCSSNPAAAVQATIDSVSSQFVASPEYVARGSTNSQFVVDMYYALLQRGAEPGAIDYWVGQLNGGLLSRSDVRQQFLASPEMQAQSAAIAAQGCLH